METFLFISNYGSIFICFQVPRSATNFIALKSCFLLRYYPDFFKKHTKTTAMHDETGQFIPFAGLRPCRVRDAMLRFPHRRFC